MVNVDTAYEGFLNMIVNGDLSESNLLNLKYGFENKHRMILVGWFVASGAKMFLAISV